ncbi:hypothetical protein HDU97_002519 [Phlyctochytrium planicorne]|nr:hypothetical protein HDU97_002519 [Phlyctochytrium planicorne]
MFPIHRLYYCDYCLTTRCPYCVQDEIVCYYCPNCLFEVPTASVKAERNRCARNCFECPICENTLTVVSETEAGTPLGDTPSSPKPPRTSSLVGSATSSTGSISSVADSARAGNPPSIHYLSCGVCRWSSLEIGIKFERPTGLAVQMQKLDEEGQDFKEFENLRDYFDRLPKHFNGGSTQSLLSQSSLSLSANVLNYLPTLGAIGSRSLSSSLSRRFGAGGKTAGQAPAFESVIKKGDTDAVAMDEKLVEEMMELNLEEVSSLPQRLQQLDTQPRARSDLKPQRIQLRCKRAKRCRKCDHILIKPEQKAQLTRFKIKQMAIDNLPGIVLAGPPINISSPAGTNPPGAPGIGPFSHASGLPPLQVGQVVQVNLRFTNPLDVEMKVELATTNNAVAEGDSKEEVLLVGNCEVNLLAPVFTLPPFKDPLDFDIDKRDDDDEEDERHGGLHGMDPLPYGVVDMFENNVIVSLMVVPKRQPVEDSKGAVGGNRVEFPLLVRITRKVPEPIPFPSADAISASTPNLATSATSLNPAGGSVGSLASGSVGSLTGSNVGSTVSASAPSIATSPRPLVERTDAFWCMVGVGEMKE